MPAGGVVHGGLGIPLRDVVGLSGMPESGETPIGHLHTERRAHGDGASGLHGGRQLHPADVDMARVIAPGGLRAIHLEIEAVDPAAVALRREMQ